MLHHVVNNNYIEGRWPKSNGLFTCRGLYGALDINYLDFHVVSSVKKKATDPWVGLSVDFIWFRVVFLAFFNFPDRG